MSEDVTLFHNPRCSTSRAALEMIRQAGIEPRIVEYLKTGWNADQLRTLAGHAGLPLRGLLRAKEPLAAELGLRDDAVSEDRLVEAMVAHPVLVERPIVETAKGVALGRPVERIRDVLP